MNEKAFKKLHTAVNIISFGMLAVYLVYMLSVYRNFPKQIGIHYGEDNEFDVYASKWLAFFPFMAGFGLTWIFTLAQIAAGKIKRIGKKLIEEDYRFIRITFIAALDAMKLFWSVFYTIWAHCVIHQTRMFTFGLPIRELQTLPLLIIIGAFLAADSKVRLKKSKKYIITAELLLIAVVIFVVIIKNNF
ncbi:DUF1648 domain-containing protein [Ruminococcus flavefaciens]|uniref:DUF1648 domain-containing protein n=1 Tax=Ruminococcus flavefaciens TaxID=1265 RepID=UPI00048F3A04|nr:DUF1648 domain-containing protein [Ruminococcus flavefaciens]